MLSCVIQFTVVFYIYIIHDCIDGQLPDSPCCGLWAMYCIASVYLYIVCRCACYVLIGSQGTLLKVSAVTCLSHVSPDSPYLISGGADGYLNLIDLRRLSASSGSTTGSSGSMIVRKFGHHTNGVHCMRIVATDSTCVFTGDGAGVLHCHSLVSESPSLVYGLGASQLGAVKTIEIISKTSRCNGYVVTGGDDGKGVSWEY